MVTGDEEMFLQAGDDCRVFMFPAVYYPTQITESDFSSPVNIYQISSGNLSNFLRTKEAWFTSPVICIINPY